MSKPEVSRENVFARVNRHPFLAFLITAVTLVSGLIGIKTALIPGSKPAETSQSAHTHGDHAIVQQAQGNGVNNLFTGSVGTVNTGSLHSIPASEKEAARQRLHDDGIDYDEERYGSALRNHETDVVSLFTQSGMLLGNNMLQFVNDFFSQDTASVLLQADQSPSCPTNHSAIGFYTALRGEPLAFVQKICNKDSVRERLNETIQRAEQDETIARHDDNSNASRLQQEIATCERIARQTWGSRISPASAHENCTMHTIPPGKEAAGAEQEVSGLNAELKVLSK